MILGKQKLIHSFCSELFGWESPCGCWEGAGFTQGPGFGASLACGVYLPFCLTPVESHTSSSSKWFFGDCSSSIWTGCWRPHVGEDLALPRQEPQGSAVCGVTAAERAPGCCTSTEGLLLQEVALGLRRSRNRPRGEHGAWSSGWGHELQARCAGGTGWPHIRTHRSWAGDEVREATGGQGPRRLVWCTGQRGGFLLGWGQGRARVEQTCLC